MATGEVLTRGKANAEVGVNREPAVKTTHHMGRFQTRKLVFAEPKPLQREGE